MASVVESASSTGEVIRNVGVAGSHIKRTGSELVHSHEPYTSIQSL